MTFAAPREGCPPAHGGCDCECHRTPGIMHFMACCRPRNAEQFAEHCTAMAKDLGLCAALDLGVLAESKRDEVLPAITPRQQDARKRFAESIRREIKARDGIFEPSAHPLALPWGEQEWKRMGGGTICDECGEEYQRHPVECGPAYGSCGDEFLYLYRLCDGRLGKL